MSSLLVALTGRLPSDSLYVASIFLAVQPFPYNSIWFAGIYVRGCIPKLFCEVYCYHNGVFCPCCGVALRMLPTNKRDKERLRQLQLRREEG